MPYLLPETLATGTTCVKISIPDTPQDIKNFLGTVLDLCYWFNYERDGTDKGSQVANIWLAAFDEIRIGACMIVRQNPDSPCILEVSNDSGETWEVWADITLCVNADYIQSLISSNESLQQTIGQYALTSAIGSDATELQNNLDTSFFQSQVLCDNDNIYGLCLQLAVMLNTVSENLLDIFVSGLQSAGRLGDLIEAIPVVGELPFDDILQFLTKVAGEINTAYQAAYDTQLQEDISCEFFCAAQVNCELTFEMARDIIKGHLASPVSIADFASMVNDMIANNWFGDQAVWVFHYFILETIIMGGEILGLDVNRFAKTVATYLNDPNSDWSVLCTSCGWTYECEFNVANCGWYPFANAAPYDAPNGVYVANTGWLYTDFIAQANSSNRSSSPQVDFTDSIVTSVIMTFNFTLGAWNGVSQVSTAIFGYKDGVLTQTSIRNLQDQPNGDGQTFGFTGLSWDVDRIRLVLRCSSMTTLGQLTGNALITNIVIQGEGSYPF